MKFIPFRKSLPLGLRIISIIYYITAILSILIALLAFLSPGIIKNVPGFGTNIAANPLAFIILGIIFLILSPISFFIAYGIQRVNNKARIALLVLCAINVIGGIISIIEGSYLSSINLVFNLLIGLYITLNKKVRREFNLKV
jgi:hypothetical protein